MTIRIGERYVEADAQRVIPVDINGYSYELFANRFDDTWAISQELPAPAGVESLEQFRGTYEEMLAQIEALRTQGYKYQQCDGSVALWTKDISDSDDKE